MHTIRQCGIGIAAVATITGFLLLCGGIYVLGAIGFVGGIVGLGILFKKRIKRFFKRFL